MTNYAHPEVLVSTDWLVDHLNEPAVRIVEVDVDTSAYKEAHIPGSLAWSWKTDLSDPIQRDIISGPQLKALLARSGIGPATTIVIYGDNNNWFAAWAFWQLKIYRHQDVRLLDGGRKKWLAEGREVTKDVPQYPASDYSVPEPDLSIRAFLAGVQASVQANAAALVDVRSPQEFTGEILAPPGLAETCQRGGHIPRARSIPWGTAAKEDGSFKTFDELRALYAAEGVDGDKPVITYCRIGERSSYSWFVLKYLLGYEDVQNYDGSWTEWGNLVGAQVERGPAAPVKA